MPASINSSNMRKIIFNAKNIQSDLNELKVNGVTVWTSKIYLICFYNDGAYFAYDSSLNNMERTNITTTCYVKYIKELELFILAVKGGVYHSKDGRTFTLATVTTEGYTFDSVLKYASEKTGIVNIGNRVVIYDTAITNYSEYFRILVSTDGTHWSVVYTGVEASETTISNIIAWTKNNYFVFFTNTWRGVMLSEDGVIWEASNLLTTNDYFSNLGHSNIFIFNNTISYIRALSFQGGISVEWCYLRETSEDDWNDVVINAISGASIVAISESVYVDEVNDKALFVYTLASPSGITRYTIYGKPTSFVDLDAKIRTLTSIQTDLPNIISGVKNLFSIAFNRYNLSVYSDDYGQTWNLMQSKLIYSLGGNI